MESLKGHGNGEKNEMGGSLLLHSFERVLHSLNFQGTQKL